MATQTENQAARKDWMSVLAKSEAAELSSLWAAVALSPEYEVLRQPEIGGVMVRGRAGGSGAPFNLGEMTVTRCAIRLETGEVGHAYVQGRDREKARQAALVDALMQTPQASHVEEKLLAPLREKQTRNKASRAAKAAATKVDFFTMVRGED